MRGYKLISFPEFSSMCSGSEDGEFVTFCTCDAPEPVSGWLHKCEPSLCRKWRGLSRAKNKELSKKAFDKQGDAIQRNCSTCRHGIVSGCNHRKALECFNESLDYPFYEAR